MAENDLKTLRHIAVIMDGAGPPAATSRASKDTLPAHSA